MDDLTRYPATRLAEMIRAREASPVEVVEAHLRRIEALNPSLNAIVTLAPDALEQARAAESAVMRGEHVGPLHGVPVTVKDTIETRGLRTTSGSLRRARHVPHEDATAVARLKAAGAILLGKTNVAEMAIDYESNNPLFGRANNPHDPARTPGGSSGGCASAVAACLTPSGLGSDLMGSLRVPAHFCGILSLKPTTGRVPLGGHFPVATGSFSLGAALGPLARQTEDLRLLFYVLAGLNQTESFSVSSEIRGWRVSWYTDDGIAPVTEETRASVEAAARALNEAGLKVEERRPPGVERGQDLWTALFSRAAFCHLRELYEGHEEQAGEFARVILANGSRVDPPALDQFIHAWTERDRLRAELVEWMKATPLMLAPVGATHAFEHGARKVRVGDQQLSIFRAFSYAQAFNVFGLPVACVPAGRSREGLPIGVQIIGRLFSEESVLAAARIIEYALGGWQRPTLPALSPEGHNPL